MSVAGALRNETEALEPARRHPAATPANDAARNCRRDSDVDVTEKSRSQFAQIRNSKFETNPIVKYQNSKTIAALRLF
jgi:hypothetical protein